MAEIAVPTVKGVQNGLMNYGVGSLAGVGYRIATNVLGSGLVGGAASSALVGSLVKGQQGDTLSLILGFETGRNLLNQVGGGDQEGAVPSNTI